MNVKIKIFNGNTVAEARAKVDREFGKDALIYDVKTVKKGGILGFFSKSMVQIIAGRNQEPPAVEPPMKKPVFATKPTGQGSVFSVPQSSPSEIVKLMELKKEILEIKERVVKMESGQKHESIAASGPAEPDSAPVHAYLVSYYEALVAQGLCKEYVKSLMGNLEREITPAELEDQAAQDPRVLRETVEARLNSRIQIGSRLEAPEETGQKMVAFVGPTGVGKTTTLVKLAGDLSIGDGRSVGVITFDTFRIGAPEQLEQYCKIMYLPCQVVYTPGELLVAIEKFKDKEYIFIDSAGRSQKNRSDMNEVKRFLSGCVGIEPYLVISATTKYEDMLEISKRFKSISYKNLIITKVDETNTIGPVYRLLHETKLPISYFTFGQSVPGDIEYADGLTFVRRLFKTSSRSTRKARLPQRSQTERQPQKAGQVKQALKKSNPKTAPPVVREDSGAKNRILERYSLSKPPKEKEQEQEG